MTDVYGKLRQRMFIECLQFYLKNSMNEKYYHRYTVYKTFYSLCDTINNKQYNPIGHYTKGCNTQAMYRKCLKKRQTMNVAMNQYCFNHSLKCTVLIVRKHSFN